MAPQDPPSCTTAAQDTLVLRSRSILGPPGAAITSRGESPKGWCQGVDSLPSPLTGAFGAKDDAIGLRETYRAGCTTVGRMLEQPVRPVTWVTVPVPGTAHTFPPVAHPLLPPQPPPHSPLPP